jgi:sugar O-acyltransferase (sialic acid O-acetyltransferase NeuD family)
MDRIIIFGCGGQARSIINVLREDNNNIEIILVDENAKADEIIMNCHTLQKYELREDDSYIIAIGDNCKRARKCQELKSKGHGRLVSVISKYSIIGIDTKIGNGTFVAPNSYIGPMAVIGDNTIINTGSVIEHETVIGNNTHIAPNATICGRTRIGDNVFCGAGSTVIDKICICNNVIIGAGAVVVKDIMENGKYVGVPAKKIG